MALETLEPLQWGPEEYFRRAARRNMTPEQLRAQLRGLADESREMATHVPFEHLRDGIRSAHGYIVEGARLNVSIQPVGGKAMTFRPTVLLAEPNIEMRWLGHFLFPGIFEGEHYFKITSSQAGQARFSQGERFTGVLVGFAKTSLDQGTKSGFTAMNAALRARAEGVQSA